MYNLPGHPVPQHSAAFGMIAFGKPHTYFKLLQSDHGKVHIGHIHRCRPVSQAFIAPPHRGFAKLCRALCVQEIHQSKTTSRA